MAKLHCPRVLAISRPRVPRKKGPPLATGANLERSRLTRRQCKARLLSDTLLQFTQLRARASVVAANDLSAPTPLPCYISLREALHRPRENAQLRCQAWSILGQQSRTRRGGRCRQADLLAKPRSDACR